jgi:hypothetical protein
MMGTNPGFMLRLTLPAPLCADRRMNAVFRPGAAACGTGDGKHPDNPATGAAFGYELRQINPPTISALEMPPCADERFIHRTARVAVLSYDGTD